MIIANKQAYFDGRFRDFVNLVIVVFIPFVHLGALAESCVYKW